MNRPRLDLLALALLGIALMLSFAQVLGRTGEPGGLREGTILDLGEEARFEATAPPSEPLAVGGDRAVELAGVHRPEVIGLRPFVLGYGRLLDSAGRAQPAWTVGYVIEGPRLLYLVVDARDGRLLADRDLAP